MEKIVNQNRVGTSISVVGRGVRSFIRWHSVEEEQRLFGQARNAYAALRRIPGVLQLWFGIDEDRHSSFTR